MPSTENKPKRAADFAARIPVPDSLRTETEFNMFRIQWRGEAKLHDLFDDFRDRSYINAAIDNRINQAKGNRNG